MLTLTLVLNLNSLPGADQVSVWPTSLWPGSVGGYQQSCKIKKCAEYKCVNKKKNDPIKIKLAGSNCVEGDNK